MKKSSHHARVELPRSAGHAAPRLDGHMHRERRRQPCTDNRYCFMGCSSRSGRHRTGLHPYYEIDVPYSTGSRSFSKNLGILWIWAFGSALRLRCVRGGIGHAEQPDSSRSRSDLRPPRVLLQAAWSGLGRTGGVPVGRTVTRPSGRSSAHGSPRSCPNRTATPRWPDCSPRHQRHHLLLPDTQPIQRGARNA